MDIFTQDMENGYYLCSRQILARTWLMAVTKKQRDFSQDMANNYTLDDRFTRTRLMDIFTQDMANGYNLADRF